MRSSKKIKEDTLQAVKVDSDCVRSVRHVDDDAVTVVVFAVDRFCLSCGTTQYSNESIFSTECEAIHNHHHNNNIAHPPLLRQRTTTGWIITILLL